MQHRVAKVVGVHEDKGDDQHRQEAEDAAEHSHDGTENRPDRLTALANRRGFDRLADADVLLQQSPFDEELLRAVQHLRRGLDKRLALLVERRKASIPTPTSVPIRKRYRTRIASQRGNRLSPIGSNRCFSMSRIIGLNPIASRPLM